ncbi:sulfate transporter [Desulfovibrio sp. X2]|uniref:SulP family inorganic anion transporter n=1 Tax=Desulfovibrio sp. X2 TaxID=941449 RepID=UPI000358726B|nr:SulP family inorganic anion transporter [Desulfovibrio sp. X2]EPR37310.1 sulfate transporter [Desulfovibrio sp. X2]
MSSTGGDETQHDEVACESLKSRALRMALPFCPEVRGYTGAKFRADLMAALTVTVVGLPQCMAYAIIAGVNPKYGLYAATIPAMIASLWGSSRYLISGPANAISMLIASSMTAATIGGLAISVLPEAQKMPYLFGIAIMAGIIQLIMGLAGVGESVRFISHSVIVGFTAGAGVLIAGGQIKNLLGLSVPHSPEFAVLMARTAEHVPETNPWSLGIGLFAIAATFLIPRLNRRLPGPFLAVTISAVLAWALDLESKGVRLIGDIPRGLPPLSLPPAPNYESMQALFMPSLAIALLSMVEALSIAKTLAVARGERMDGSQEILGQGLSNIAAGFFSGIPGSGSFTRTAVNFLAGGRTRFSGVFAGLMSLVFLLLLAPYASYIPVPVLAGILLVIAWGMIDKPGILQVMRSTRADRAVLLATVASTLVLDLEKAVFIGVLLSIALFLRKVSHPQVSRLDTCESPELAYLPIGPCCPYLSVYQIEGALFFGAVDELEQRLYEYEDFGHRVVILHLRHVHSLDATGVHAFESFLNRCRKRGVVLILSGAKPGVREVFRNSGLLAKLGREYMVQDLSQALELAYDKCLKNSVCARCKEDTGGECRMMRAARTSAGTLVCSLPLRRPATAGQDTTASSEADREEAVAAPPPDPAEP